eukprot:13909947-Heterocapsa_arctica.AAC.1
MILRLAECASQKLLFARLNCWMSRVPSSSVIPSRDNWSLIAARSTDARSIAFSAADTSGRGRAAGLPPPSSASARPETPASLS